MRHTSSIIENTPHRVFHDGVSGISVCFDVDVSPETVDQAFAEWNARTRAMTHRDFYEDVNGVCALLNIPIMLSSIDECDFGAPCVIMKHEYRHKNPKVEKLIEYLRELLLSHDTPNYLDKTLCMELLSSICDLLNFTGHETPRDTQEWLEARALRSHYDADNAAAVTCGMLSKKLKEVSEPCDTKPWKDLLEALVTTCTDLDCSKAPAYLEARAALYGDQHADQPTV